VSRYTDPQSETDVAAIINAAVVAATPVPITPGGLYVAVVPQGHTATVVDDRDANDRRAEAPRRRKGTANLTRTESFTAYVQANTFADAEVGPALYADDDRHEITAVFNGAGPALPGWGDDRAVLRLVTTDDWKAWTARDQIPMTQVMLAEFLEDHQRNVVSPDGATLLELVTTFEAMTNVEVQSVTRLTNGTRQLVWKETTTARAGQVNQAEFPDSFLLELVPFEGLAPVAVGARLRYKVTRDHGLQLTFLLDDTDTVLRDAFDAVLAAVEQDLGLVAYHGSPPV
jgi:uncharacterized protein YfdQ (DUF2303 family)